MWSHFLNTWWTNITCIHQKNRKSVVFASHFRLYWEFNSSTNIFLKLCNHKYDSSEIIQLKRLKKSQHQSALVCINWHSDDRSPDRLFTHFSISHPPYSLPSSLSLHYRERAMRDPGCTRSSFRCRRASRLRCCRASAVSFGARRSSVRAEHFRSISVMGNKVSQWLAWLGVDYCDDYFWR